MKYMKSRLKHTKFDISQHKLEVTLCVALFLVFSYPYKCYR